MAAIDFPASPTSGDYFSSGSITWLYDGSKWVISNGSTSAAWTSWVPTLTQGVTVTKSILYAKYRRFGNTVEFQTKLTVTSAGTSGSKITISLPFTAAQAGVAVGASGMWDGGVGYKPTISYLDTSTTCAMIPAWDISAGSYLGQTDGGGAFALASNDEITLSGSYEAAY